MKISRIYSNFENEFKTIDFCNGFNVVLGQIFHPENLQKDAHNLGKSKLSELIDFCLLKGRNPVFFLFKFPLIFTKYVFFIEILLNSGSYITIRRGVDRNTKISIKKHDEGRQLYRGDGWSWDYEDEPIGVAKTILDSYFDLAVVGAWDYRDAVAYCLRSQEDYTEVFKLDKFRGQHVFWKPYLGHILGFEASALVRNYQLKNEIDALSIKLIELKKLIGAVQGDQEEILNRHLQAKMDVAKSLKWQMENLNFDESDKKHIEDLTGEIDSELEDINRVKYYLSARLRKLQKTAGAGGERFNIDSVSQLFEEAGVVFGEQIKRSYSELVEFNRQITSERREFVRQQKEELEQNLDDISVRASELNFERSKKLSYLNSYDIFSKYKEVSQRLAEVDFSIVEINKSLEVNESIKNLEEDYRKLLRDKGGIVDSIRINRDEVVVDKEGIYNRIKDGFEDYISGVLSKNGVITTEQNGEGNLDYFAGLIGSDGKITGESDGYSYKKILCIGFDLAVMSAYSDMKFVRFLYHDGGLETLDDRKKIEFIEYVRTVSSINGFQYILTVIESDLPAGFKFPDHEVVRVLHDDGPSGRLFNIPSW
ncbi:DUF2326 domain-containing protein [Pseudomonas fragi]|uniref:DUF2326 domain-containing protein n=1 Tax=Pseudomonas fragi TaxID=296 RepID=A0A9Q5AZK2_PSEFR|nr:DUF2326 domain-containing protein [Pseudomonas fragi]NNB49525.1 DUF2326 domain-containing protein [Pseudomonas fragi]